MILSILEMVMNRWQWLARWGWGSVNEVGVWVTCWDWLCNMKGSLLWKCNAKEGYVDPICSCLWSERLRNGCQILLGTDSYPACDMNPKGVIPTQSRHCSKQHNKLAIALGSHALCDGYVQRHWSCLRGHLFLHSFQDTFKCHLSEFSFFPRYLAWERILQCVFGWEAWRQCRVTDCLEVKTLLYP